MFPNNVTNIIVVVLRVADKSKNNMICLSCWSSNVFQKVKVIIVWNALDLLVLVAWYVDQRGGNTNSVIFNIVDKICGHRNGSGDVVQSTSSHDKPYDPSRHSYRVPFDFRAVLYAFVYAFGALRIAYRISEYVSRR